MGFRRYSSFIGSSPSSIDISLLQNHFEFEARNIKTPKGSAFENTISIIMPFHATDPWSRVCDGKFDWSIDHGFLEMRHSNEY